TSLPPETTPRGERNQVIDLMKGLLIIGMVLSHVHSGLNLSVPWLDPRRGIPQLTIFSGLFFAFGYGTYKAYLEKTTIPYRRLVLNIIRILLAYYLCVIAYEFFNDHVLSLKSLLSIVQLDFLVPYTEFLLAYVIILILVLIIPRIFNTVARKDILFWPVMGGLLIASLFDYTQNTSVWLSLVIGSETITSYPVVQYLPLYLMGIYFAQRQIRFSWKFLAGAILAIAGFLVFRGNGQVSRYPPSFFWIVGSMGAVYVCYLISHLIFFITPLQKPLVDIGRHALYWMVMSDLFIFSISTVLKNIPLPSYWVAGIIIGIFFCIAYLSFLARK
ncbi:MAG: hypothetical protein M1281_01500, partial [Chloroflexi bacterium]|nr:hypothetical protein [Chloroflexota bacterium]